MSDEVIKIPGNDVFKKGNFDSFGRFRTSGLTTLTDIKQLGGKKALLVDERLIGSATSTHSTTDSSTTMSVTASSGDKAVGQTFQRFNYQSGKSHLIMMTFSGFQPETDVVKRIGYFSSSTTSPYSATLDGIFLQSDSNGISINIYKSGTLTSSVSDSDFNGISLGGIDWSKSQILYIDFEWLGTGVIRWGIVRNGEITYFHISRHDNFIDGTYMTSPNQPLRWEIESTGGAGSFKYICASVNSEGSLNKIGVPFSDYTGSTGISASAIGTIYPLLGIRLKTTHLFEFIDNLKMSLLGSTNNDKFYYLLLLNPTYGGTGTFNYTGVINGSVEIGKPTGAVTATGGFLVDSEPFISQTNQTVILDNTILGVDLDGVVDELVLCVMPLTTSLTVYASLSWRELS